MTTEKIDGVSVTTQASVYFDGKCVSHGITFPDGTKKSVGVVLPAALTFNTGAAEIMECVAGSCEYRLDGTDTWLTSAPGQRFSIAAGNEVIETGRGFRQEVEEQLAHGEGAARNGAGSTREAYFG